MRGWYFLISVITIMCSALACGHFINDLTSWQFAILPGFLFSAAVGFPTIFLFKGQLERVVSFVIAMFVVWICIVVVSFGFLAPVFLKISQVFALPVIGSLGALAFVLLYFRLILKAEPSWIIILYFSVVGYLAMFLADSCPEIPGLHFGLFKMVFLWQAIVGFSTLVLALWRTEHTNTATSS